MVKILLLTYFDVQQDALILGSEISLKKGVHPAVIVFSVEQNSRKVVTIYPCADLEKEINKKLRTKRWAKIE